MAGERQQTPTSLSKMRQKYKRSVGFTLELVKHLRFEYNKARETGAKQFWFPIGYYPKKDLGIEAELDTDYAQLMLEFLEPQFGIENDALQNRRPN